MTDERAEAFVSELRDINALWYCKPLLPPWASSIYDIEIRKAEKMKELLEKYGIKSRCFH